MTGMSLRRMITRLGTFLLYGGTQRLAGYERAILDHLEGSIAESDRETLRSQLGNLDHIKRLHDGRMVTFYFFDSGHLPRLKDIGDEVCIAAYRLSTKDIKPTVRVVTHKGLLSSLEFSKSPRGLDDKALVLSPAQASKRSRSIAEVVDRMEHGKR